MTVIYSETIIANIMARIELKSGYVIIFYKKDKIAAKLLQSFLQIFNSGKGGILHFLNEFSMNP